MIFAELKLHVAGVCNYPGVIYGFGKGSEYVSHLLLALEIELVIGKSHPVLVIYTGGRLYRQQNIVSLRIFFSYIVDIVGSYHGYTQLPAYLNELRFYHGLFFQSLILNLNIEVALSEDFKKLCSFLLSPFIVSVEQLILHFSRKTGRKSYDTLAVLSENFFVYARLIIISFYVAGRNYLYKVFIPFIIFSQQNKMTLMLVLIGLLICHPPGRSIDLAAYYRFYSLFFTFFIEVYDSEHGSVVGYSKTVHAQLFGVADQIFDPCGSVQQTVFRMYV